MELSDQIRQADNLIAFLDRFKDIPEILRTAQSIKGSMGDLLRDQAAEKVKLEEAKKAVAETQEMLEKAKGAVNDQAIRLESLNRKIAASQSAHALILQAVQADKDNQAAVVDQSVRQYREAKAKETDEYVAGLQAQIDALTSKRDTLQTEIDSLLKRLGG